MKPTRETIRKELSFIVKEAQKALDSFDAHECKDAYEHLLNLRAAATVSKQDIDSYLCINPQQQL